jgi:hypothetical protein
MNRFLFSPWIVTCLFCAGAIGQGSPKQIAEPATAAQAASVLDLTSFPMVDVDTDADAGQKTQLIASQSYPAKGTVINVAKKIQAELLKKGFTEAAGASITDDYGSATYVGRGFTITMTVFPGSKPTQSQVNIQNLGNVDLAKLPIPTGAKLLYAMPAVAAYVANAPVDKTKTEMQQLLRAQGWEPFGDTASSFYVKKNAIRLQVMITEAPGLDGKTSIQFSSEQLSVDLPTPPAFVSLQFTDSTGRMLMDSKQSQEEVVSYFKKSLGQIQWKPTTENTVRIGYEDCLIFRNEKKEMIEIKFRQVEGKTRADLRYQTAKQFAEDEKKADALIAELKKKREAEMERKKNPTKIEITAPTQSTASASGNNKSIEFTTKSGAAKASLQAWMKNQETEGWKKKVTIDTKEAGDYTLEKDGVEIHASFIDPGFIPGSITISVRGDYQLSVKK